MTTTTTTTPETGTCLVCARVGIQVTKHWRVLVKHTRTEDDTSSGDCPGAGHPSVQDDGRDDVRRYAIRAYGTAHAKAQKTRTEFSAALESAKWTGEGAILAHAADLMRYETVANMWRDLARHGQWITSLAAATRTLTNDPVHESRLVEALWREERRGVKDWVATGRARMVQAVDDGVSGKDIQTIVFSL